MSSLIRIGFAKDPSFSSGTAVGRGGSLALRHVACRAKQARVGANDEVVETVLTEDIEDAREERVRSEIMDSGLERGEAVLMDGRREVKWNLSMSGRMLLGKPSMVHLLRPAFCARAIAEHMDGRREPQTLAAGVFEATDDGVNCGVGNGPMRARAGVGGARSGFGSKYGGRTVRGVGVLSFDVEATRIGFNALRIGVGVVGEEKP